MNTIEFCGELSLRAQKHIRKHDNAIAVFGGLFADLFLLPIAIGLLIYMIQDDFPLWGICFISALMLLVLLLFPMAFMKSEKNFQKILPQKITIDADGTITLYREVNPLTQSLENVKDVRDYGDYYDINFALIGSTGLFICQKNLLTQGSIEEFERLFEKKIVRMNQ